MMLKLRAVAPFGQLSMFASASHLCHELLQVSDECSGPASEIVVCACNFIEEQRAQGVPDRPATGR